MIRRLFSLLIVLIPPYGNALAQQAADPDALKGEVCQECHGQAGISTSPYVPKLAGQSADYIIKQIHDFQSGARKHPIMSTMAENIDGERLNRIAAYFSAQPKAFDETGDDDGTGRRLFQAGDSRRIIPACASCHGQTGTGNFGQTPPVPMIGGQRKGYLIAQLQAWRNGDRKNSPDGVMNMIAQPLTDSEIQSLAGFVATLR